MAVLLTSSHDGTAGTNTGNSWYGNASVAGAGGGQSTLVSANKRAGTTCMRFDSTDAYRTYTYSFGGDKTKAAWRGYYYFSALPSANTLFFRFMRNDTQYCGLQWSTTGKIRLQNGNTAVWTSTNSYQNTAVRIEIRYNHDTGLIKVRLFSGANYETTTATEDSGDITPSVANPPNKAVWGWAASGGPQYWVDDIALHDNVTSFIGPVGGGSPPSAAFTFSPTGGDAPLTVAFTDTSTGTPTSWLWDFGDGSPTSTSQNPTHEYDTAGTYTVSLTATNANGSTAAATQITVTEPAFTTLPVYVRIAGVMTLRTGSKRQVRVGGSLVNITTINGVSDVIDPPPPPPADLRFPGDPGEGRAYIGSNRPNNNNTESTRVGWVRDRMSSQTTSVSGPKTRKPTVIRSYVTGSAGVANQPGYDWDYPERSTNRTISRRLVQWAHDYGAIPWVQVQVREIGSPGADVQDGWMDQLASAYDKGLTGLNAAETNAINEVKTLAAHLMDYAPNPIWLSLDHEPEDNITPTQTARLTRFRKAQRAIVLTLRREGVTNTAIVACTFMTMTVRGGGGRDWRAWYPDWKGTSTGGATSQRPFPNGSTADFYTGTTKTGALTESVVDIVGHDIYYWDWEWKATTAIDNANRFLTVAATAGWGADHQAALNLGIHTHLGKPWAIGEIGTQAAGYLGTNGTLIQRAQDLAAMDTLAMQLGPGIEDGNLVAVAYFNNSEHAWGHVDPQFSKAKAFALLHDTYNVAPPIQ